MAKRELLQEVIEGFEVRRFTRFLSAANSAFKPVTEDFSHYLENADGLFSDFAKMGQIEFSDAGTLIVTAARIANELTDRTSKKKQYDLAKKVLKKTQDDAGLFLFYDDNGHFRLSLVCAQYMGPKRQFTAFRRYTYFVSLDLSNKTFLNQVGKCSFGSIDDILEAFSIEAVSGAFYDEFKPKFDEIAASVKGLPRVPSALREDFALLFAIRIIFLGFVQKRCWLGDNQKFIRDFWEEYHRQFEGDAFYANWLCPLFFEALNSEPGTTVGWNDNDFSKETERILQMAPYLNGELFKKKTGVDDQDLWIPDKIIGEFIDWLFQYNFTIEENDLYDEELELNPEFLGIIFERLVNKVDGAVYTPRPEVDLMCRLALLNWLDKNTKIDKRELYYQFFREGGQGSKYDDDQKDGNFSANEIRQLVELLESLTVCDPAAGSGAFEVGMLHVINETLESLYANLKCPADIEHKSPFERKKAIIGKSLYGVEVKRWAVWINQLRLWLTLFIDMPDEMKNSHKPLLPSLNFKVRRGDSLVQRVGGKLFPVHEQADVTKPIKKKIEELKKAKLDFFYNRGMDEPMVKQMEYKVFEAIIHSEIDEINKRIAQNKQSTGKGASGPQMNFFEAAVPVSGKQKKLVNDKEPTEPIWDIKLENRKRQLYDELKKLADDHPLLWSIEFSEIFYDKGGFDIIIGNPPYVRPKDVTDPDGYLEPKTYKETLAETIRLDYPKYFNEKNVKIDGNSDLFIYFYLRSLHLLNEQGVHVFICSNSWLDVGYGTWMQEFFLNNVPVRWIIDNHARRSFTSVDVNTIISVMDAPLKKGQVRDDHLIKFVAFKKPFEECIFTEKLLELDVANEIVKNDVFRVYPITNRQLYDEGWKIEEGAKQETGQYIGDKWGGKYLRAPDIYWKLAEAMANQSFKLGSLVSIQRGFSSGANKFFYLDDETIDQWKIEKVFVTSFIDSPRSCYGIPIDRGLCRKLFTCNRDKEDLRGSGALKYINWGESQGWQKKTTCLARKRWYDLGSRHFPMLAWPRTFFERHICYNLPSKTHCSDRFYGLFGYDDMQSMALFLNSTIVSLQVEVNGYQVNHGGIDTSVWWLTDMPIIKNFSASAIEAFESISKRNILLCEDELKKSDRIALDRSIFEQIGLDPNLVSELYDAVCHYVKGRIKKAGRDITKTGRGLNDNETG